MINWEEVAKDNKLSPKEFEREILMCAACLASLKISKGDTESALKFTCNDELSDIELYIKRV